MLAKEVLILIARERGAAVTELSLIAGLDTSNISRRHDAALEKLQTDRKLIYARDPVAKICLASIAESQTRHQTSCQTSCLQIYDSVERNVPLSPRTR